MLIRPDTYDRCSVNNAGLCFNLKSTSASSDEEEEYDDIETINFLKSQLESLGAPVTLYEQDDRLFERLREDRPGFVFNIAEGKGQGRARESQVPAILEWLKIPYYGSDAVSMGVTLDKRLTSACLFQAGVPVPRMLVADRIAALNAGRDFFDGRRYIVKPRWEGSSKGVFQDSLAVTLPEVLKRVQFIVDTYHQPAVVEEFIDGEELTVGIVGNDQPEIIGMMSIRPIDTRGPFIYSIEHKRTWRDTIRYDLADKVLSGDLLANIRESALNAFRVLELRDAARIDLRVDNNGRACVIDVNPLPGLSPVYSDLMLMSHLQGQEFAAVVRKIMRGSLRRHGLLASQL